MRGWMVLQVKSVWTSVNCNTWHEIGVMEYQPVVELHILVFVFTVMLSKCICYLFII